MEVSHLQGVKSLFQVISTFFPLSCGSVKFAPPVDEFLLLQPEIPKLLICHKKKKKKNPRKTASAPRSGKQILHQPHPRFPCFLGCSQPKYRCYSHCNTQKDYSLWEDEIRVPRRTFQEFGAFLGNFLASGGDFPGFPCRE